MTTPTKPRVLCVDDEPGVLRSLEALLRGRFDVSSAASAREGLALMHNSAFDVVISDQRMPGMSGTEFLEQVKEMSPQTMRLLLTGHAEVTDVLRSVNDSEVFRYIHKPWDNQHLVDMVTYAATVARDVPLQRPANRQANPADEALADPDHRFGSDIEAVLLMDEDPTTERQLRTVLGEDMLLLWARGPGEAVSLMQRHKVAVMVADAQAGNGATLDLIRAVKRSSPNIVAVVYAANCDSATIGRLINEGQIFRFISKPAGLTGLGRTIQAALSKHRQFMEQPASIARHALDISRLAARARSRHDPVNAAQSDAPGAMVHAENTPRMPSSLPQAPRSGMGWLKRLFSRV
ncbi:MAG: response regulator [Hydrogenophaga sp.]|uniref:response regulator n=1 Tax=Hydrogenophaga sp. TaxID=1904254 RepID=UPI002ABBA6CD|nr:response regulator [Hydrogenophaga sp.]MDZ4281344.1 response regulator [Hydrogenophaga sp.]